MRAVVQRVSRARVSVGHDVVGDIGCGLLVLLGVAHEDTEADADYLADKIAGLRIFQDASEDAGGKMNRAVGEVAGSILVVSQFTLYGDVRRGGGLRSMLRLRRKEHARSTSIVSNVFAPQDCAVRLADFRK